MNFHLVCVDAVNYPPQRAFDFTNVKYVLCIVNNKVSIYIFKKNIFFNLRDIKFAENSANMQMLKIIKILRERKREREREREREKYHQLMSSGMEPF